MKKGYSQQSGSTESNAAPRVTTTDSLVFSRYAIGNIVALADAAAVFISGYTGYLIYPGWSADNHAFYLAAMVINALLTIAVFYERRLYSINAIYHPTQQFHKILWICMFTVLVLVGMGFAFKISLHFSRSWLFTWLASLVLAIYLVRAGAYFVLDYCVRRGSITQNIAIVGGEVHGQRLIKHLERRKEPWMRIVGVFDDRLNRIPARVGQHAMLGGLSDLIRYAQRQRVDDVLVALPLSADARVMDIVQTLSMLPVRIRLCPDAVAFNFLNRDSTDFGGVSALNVLDVPIAGWGAMCKSIMDRVLTLFVLIPGLPLIAVIALMIKLDSPGPVFFRQQRYGFNQRLITVLKFRSMHVDQQDDNAARLVTRGDSRLTRTGRLLRRTSLDELPQLVNVLKGEMSLVGPRPHALQAKAADMLYQDLVSEYAARHKVKPGITGWAQVNGWRGETDTAEKIEKRVEHDLYYIAHWSPMFDMYIILYTLVAIMRNDNAY